MCNCCLLTKHRVQRLEIVHKRGSAGAAEGWAAPWWVPTQAQATLQKSLGVLNLFKQERVDKGIETDGSNLSGVSAKCAWDDLSRPPEDDEDSRSICIGTQPRRLSGKGKRSWTKSLSRPFSFWCVWAVHWVILHLQVHNKLHSHREAWCISGQQNGFWPLWRRQERGKEFLRLFCLNVSFSF